jgi:uncharacterized membrane protein
MLLITAWLDYKTIIDIAKKLNITLVLDKMQDYRRNWIQHVNRMPCKFTHTVDNKKTTHQKADRNQG